MRKGDDSASMLLTVAWLLLASFGVFVSAVLSLGEIRGLALPCGGSAGCAVVASSAYSRVFGVPLAYVGLAGYLLLFLLGHLTATRRWLLATRVGSVVAGLGLTVSLFLLGVSLLKIQVLCSWCLASTTAMTLLTLVVFLKGRAATGPVKWTTTVPIAGLGLAGGLAGAFFISARATKLEVDLHRLQSVSWETLVPADAASKGPTNPGVTLVEFADFNCPACQEVHFRLKRILGEGGIRIVFRHLPHGSSGHESSLHAAIASEIANEGGKFWEFADRAFSLPAPHSPAKYDEILQILGLSASASSAARQRVERDRRLAGELGIEVTPVFLILTSRGVRYATTNVDLEEALRQLHGLAR